MKNQIKKVVGMVLLVAVLFTTVGQEAQAAKQIKWPYGIYQCTKKLGGKVPKLDWQFYTDYDAYPEFIQIWGTNVYLNTTREYPYKMALKKIGTNLYESEADVMYNIGKYYRVKVYKKSLKIKEFTETGRGLLFPKTNKWYTFKLKKRLSKNVG